MPVPFSVGITCGGFTMGFVSAAFVVVVVLVVDVALGDSADTGSAGVSSWACSLKSVSSDLALPHYDTRDVLAITDLPYMVVSHDLGQCAIALSQLENTLPRVLEPLTS